MIKKNSILNPIIYFFKFSNNFILWDIFGKKKKFIISYLFFKNFIFTKKKVDISFKNIFLEKLDKKRYSRKRINFYKSLIPDIFFQKYEPIMRNKIIKVSTLEFLINNYYLNIFFRVNKPIIHGYQHGLGGDFFLDNKGENKITRYEKKISKKFFPLFPLGKSFGRYNLKKKLEIKQQKIIWVQRRSITNLEKFMLGTYAKILSDKFYLKSLDNKLSKIKNLYYSLHNNDYLFKPKKCKKFYPEKKLENIINRNDIIIFDSIAPTLFHFVLQNKLNFLFIINKNFNLSLLNPKFRKLIKFLIKNKYIFKFNEFYKFKEEIDIMLKDNNYTNKKNKILDKIYV